jgi:cytochrome c553
MKYLAILVTAFFLLQSCSSKNSDMQESAADTASLDAIHPGKKLMETHCYLCHSPTAPELEGRIGPPMVAIKAWYMEKHPKKASFQRAIYNFLEKPSQENALMKEAVARHGLMPYQKFSDEVIQQITEFMFEYRIQEPDWFAGHWEKARDRGPYRQPGKMFEEEGLVQTPKEIGLKYALETKQVLGKHLMEALQSKGAVHALEFCNTKAIPLTDSMGTIFNANIRRVSDKPRNPGNQANPEELVQIESFKKQLAEGKEPVPVLLKKEGIAHFYYPITTNSMCLQCHGKKSDLQPELLQKVARLYPEDRATGYSENEVRGIWSIAFDPR